VRGNASWRPIMIISVVAGALFVVFLILPWGNASFLVAILVLFAWLAVLGIRLAMHQDAQEDQQRR
jgi:hypothetical protein